MRYSIRCRSTKLFSDLGGVPSCKGVHDIQLRFSHGLECDQVFSVASVLEYSCAQEPGAAAIRVIAHFSSFPGNSCAGGSSSCQRHHFPTPATCPLRKARRGMNSRRSSGKRRGRGVKCPRCTCHRRRGGRGRLCPRKTSASPHESFLPFRACDRVPRR